MSWFQVARAKEGLDDFSGATEGYERALALNPDYDHALFNLGGVHWNSGQQRRGIEIWRGAVARFPDHPRVPELFRQLGQFL